MKKNWWKKGGGLVGKKEADWWVQRRMIGGKKENNWWEKGG